MRALSRKTLRQKVEMETEKYMQDNYAELAYHAVCEQAPNIMQQTEAVLLYALSLHGYGAKRLKDVHDWYCAIMGMPSDLMGKSPKMPDVQKIIREKYGIDFDRVKPRFQTFEEYRDGKTD